MGDDLVRKIRMASDRKKSDASNLLTDIERQGNPAAIAAEFMNLHAGEREEYPIRAPRASSLYDACMRYHVIGTMEELLGKRWADMKSSITYGIGDAIHYWAQNTDRFFGDKRRGWWKCLACGRVRYFGRPPRKPCKCGASVEATTYHEHGISIRKPWVVTGHADMFFEPTSSLFRGAEIKTISGDQFPTLIAPLVQHVWQITTYLMTVQFDKNMPVTIDDRVGYLVYISKKEHADMFPIKVFPVVKNELITKPISDKLLIYKEGLKTYPKKLPALHTQCERSKLSCYRSRNCEAFSICERLHKKGR